MPAPIPHTCPDIDAIQSTIQDQHKDLSKAIDELKRSDENAYTESAIYLIQGAMDELEPLFTIPKYKWHKPNPLEDLRKSNDSLRYWGNEKEDELSQADDKISTLEAEIESFEYQLQEAKDLNERLQVEISDADEQIRCQQTEINELKAKLLMYVK